MELYYTLACCQVLDICKQIHQPDPRLKNLNRSLRMVEVFALALSRLSPPIKPEVCFLPNF